jgi:hypothetical protein
MHLIWDCLLCSLCVSAVFFFYAITRSTEIAYAECNAERGVEEGD